MGTAEDFVPLPILQDHFEAAPVLHVRRSHALNVLSCRRHGSGHQVSLCQRVPLTATSGDDVVDEEQGSCPARFYRRTVTVRAGREEAASQPGAAKDRRRAWFSSRLFQVGSFSRSRRLAIRSKPAASARSLSARLSTYRSWFDTP